jgi:serine/threonine-protein kinase
VDHVFLYNPVPNWDRYAIVELIGEGGMGVVYRAIDRRLQRTVALKFLRSLDPDDVARFQRAAKAQAGLDHEHVCRVFEVGEVDGRGFLAMQYIEGETLRSLVNQLDLEEKLELLEQVARAVQAAHAEQVVHRDLKPGNIMVERRPDGRLHAYVLDFGIARDMGGRGDDEPSVPMGTPAFMAPEQMTNDGRTLDHRIDVYGLGATLYAVLAEQAPFFGATRAETKSKVLNEQPLGLGLVVPGMSEDLETIVEVAMSKDPARRYPSARSFADDLRRWLDGKPIRTRRAGPFYRLNTWVRTRRMAAAVLALVLLTSAAAVGSTLWMRYREYQRQALVGRYQHEVELIDRVLRRARMMPLHDATVAENDARARLDEVEGSLLEYGPLARGPAYHTLGVGHLMLREFDTAEHWLRAALDSGFSPPEVETALGVALAMQVLVDRRDGGDRAVVSGPVVEEALRRLARRGPATADFDHFHRALGLFLEGEMDEALDHARASSSRASWLYEARQLEGDILVARSTQRATGGDVDGAVGDLRLAGDAYRIALGIARSDAPLYEAEARRLLELIELQRYGSGRLTVETFDRAIDAAAAANVIHPGCPRPMALASRAHLAKADHLARFGGNGEPELVEAVRFARGAAELEPGNPILAGLQARAETMLSESRGAITR